MPRGRVGVGRSHGPPSRGSSHGRVSARSKQHHSSHCMKIYLVIIGFIAGALAGITWSNLMGGIALMTTSNDAVEATMRMAVSPQLVDDCNRGDGGGVSGGRTIENVGRKVRSSFLPSGSAPGSEANNKKENRLRLSGGGVTGDAPGADGAQPFKRVHCDDLVASFASSSALNDPNNGTLHKRLTVTDPPFWISLHERKTDPTRWGIMRHGFYYEKYVTRNARNILVDYQMRNKIISKDGGGGKRQRQRGIVIDVGMNIGWFTLLARALGHDTVSFEPNPINQLRLCESLGLNGWLPLSLRASNGTAGDMDADNGDVGVKVYGYGVGDKDDVLSLRLRGPGAATFRRVQKFSSVIGAVRIVTLDSVAEDEGWLQRGAPKIPLLKVDVEGYDPAVFRGATKIIKSGLVENIFMEYTCDSDRLRAEMEMKGVAMQLTSANYGLKNIGTWHGGPIEGALAEVVGENVTNGGAMSSDLPKRLFQYCRKRNTQDKSLNLWWQHADLWPRARGSS